MRDKDRDKLRLVHIVEACERIKSYYPLDNVPILDKKSIEFFGLVKNLEIIGEASYMLTPEFTNNHPDTQWNDMIRMRHLMVHGYFHISPEIVKDIVETEIEKLQKQINHYLLEFKN